MTPSPLEARARELLAEATGLDVSLVRPENDDDRVLQGSAIRALVSALSPNTGLIQALERIAATAEASPELNMSNYDHDDVSALNDAMISVVLDLRQALSTLGESQANDAGQSGGRT
jgi:hypothetical protein